MKKVFLFVSVLLIFLSVRISAQNATHDLELFYYETPEDNVEFGDIHQLPSGDYLAIYDIWFDWKLQASLPTVNLTQGLIKISHDGEIMINKTYPSYGYNKSRPFIVNPDNSETILISYGNPYNSNYTDPYYDPDVKDARIFFEKIDDNLDIVYSKEYPIVLDTTPGYDSSNNQDAKLQIYSVFPEEDGIWTCMIKMVPINYPLPGVLGNDSLLFYKFDYDGNIIKRNSLELDGIMNDGFKRNLGTSDDNGYTFIVNGLMDENWPKRLTMQRFDKEFNFIDEVNYPSYNKDFLANVSTKRLSDGKILVAGTYDHMDSVANPEESLTIFDDKLVKHKEIIREPISG